MERKSFPFFVAYYEAAQHLSAKDRAAFYNAIIDYSFTAKEPSLKGQAAMCWILVKPYLEKSMDDFLNGSKGGRPRKNKNRGFAESENPGFETQETAVLPFPETNMKLNLKEEYDIINPTAPPAAYAPHMGARGGTSALDSALDNGDGDAATDEARRRFFEANNITRQAWAVAEAAPPDAEKKE